MSQEVYISQAANEPIAIDKSVRTATTSSALPLSSTSTADDPHMEIQNGVNGERNGVEKKFSVPFLLEKKRDGKALTKEEIFYLVEAFVKQEGTPAQLGAFCMAVFLRGMTKQETINLTDAFIQSGDIFTWPAEWRHLVVDKHSTGGVGDKVSIPLVPALAACGLKVPMISGRGLQHTGGTLDKLEAIPGFQVSQSPAKVRHLVETVGCCIVGQTSTLNPADKIFYATRNDTSTVACIPLVVASIVSKKAVEGTSSLVLDVKFGSAAFMQTKQEATTLAHEMVNVGEGLGIKTTALLSRMDNPIGQTIGNSLEIKESIRCLCGQGPDDLEQLVVAEGAILLHSSGLVSSVEEGERVVQGKLRDGSALSKFEEMIIAQGVKPEVAAMLCEKDGDVHRVLMPARNVTEIRSSETGFVHQVKAMDLALLCLRHGAGRAKAGDKLSMAVGMELTVRIGDTIEKGNVWAKFHHDQDLSDQDRETLESCLLTKPHPAEKLKLVDSWIRSQ
ncbi:thymidine phosphorylase-like [Lineus longissimus]|uniref:thymidine phosphorylase-like n=1 Tax=Lineus longissimus TaxID=88925 RepID=UPI002B4FADD0